MNNWRELVKQERFTEAERMIAGVNNIAEMSGDDVADRGWFYEKWGDFADDKAEKINLYRKSDHYLSIYASWSTSGGEGTARMADATRVRHKLFALDKK